jgi:hypothetical protein
VVNLTSGKNSQYFRLWLNFSVLPDINLLNDIADNLHSTARVFADDCVIYRPIHTEKDHQLMQEDLDTLVGWSDTWQMEFNVSKCAIMQTTNKRKFTIFPSLA